MDYKKLICLTDNHQLILALIKRIDSYFLFPRHDLLFKQLYHLQTFYYSPYAIFIFKMSTVPPTVSDHLLGT
jgi:hypothetical protein